LTQLFDENGHRIKRNAVLSNEIIKMTAIGESTGSGFYRGYNHRVEYGGEPIPNKNSKIEMRHVPSDVSYLVKAGIMYHTGIGCEIDNYTTPSTTVDWHLGKKDGNMSVHYDLSKFNSAGFPKGSAGCEYGNMIRSDSDIVFVQLGLNDTVTSTPEEFAQSFSHLLLNIVKTGKVAYVQLPNAILDTGTNIVARLRVKQFADIQIDVANSFKPWQVIVTNKSELGPYGVEVECDDHIHPSHGKLGAYKLTKPSMDVVGEDAIDIVYRKATIKIHIALIGSLPTYDIGEFVVNKFKENITDEDVADFAIQYVQNTFGKLTPLEWITNITKNCIGRDPRPTEIGYWVGKGINSETLIEMIQDMTGYRPYCYPGVEADRPVYSSNDINIFKHRIKAGVKHTFIDRSVVDVNKLEVQKIGSYYGLLSFYN